MRFAVIVPVYNEIRLLEKSIARLTQCPAPVDPGSGPIERLVIIVDDGSTDGTTEVVRRLGESAGIQVHLQSVNQGKGAAVRRGLSMAAESGVDFAIIHDADLEYDPADHAIMLAPLLDGRADAVIGSRFLGQTHRVLYFWHYVVNRFLTFVSNMLTNLNLTDMECCLKAFSIDVVKRLELHEDRFGFEPEIVAQLSKIRLPVHEPDLPQKERALRIYEVAVSYAGRTFEEGKKIRWTDGVEAIVVIVRRNLFG